MKDNNLCNCSGIRVQISASIESNDPVGNAELHKHYETCPYCATCLSTGDMEESIKVVLKDIIEKNRRI